MHIPVLQQEVIRYLAPKPGENFIDATIGLAGHAKAILEKIKPDGKILGIELSQELCRLLREKNIHRLILVQDSYADLKKLVEQYNFTINGVLFDLGLSSWHLEKSGKGFSFQKDEPLDMRYGATTLTAEEIINKWPEKELVKILKEFGEERFARLIVREITDSRKKEPIKTTKQLAEIIKRAVPERYCRKKHPAKKTFQALRIAVNRELENLKAGLPQALEVLEKRGRLVVISFHSLEDRIVKNFFKDAEKKGRLCVLTKKPSRPKLREIEKNPRARSAKLRAAVKI